MVSLSMLDFEVYLLVEVPNPKSMGASNTRAVKRSGKSGTDTQRGRTKLIVWTQLSNLRATKTV